MIIAFTAEDEAKIKTAVIQADCYLVGDDEAEVKIINMKRPSWRKLDSFAAKTVKKLSKEGITKVSFIAAAGTETELLMRGSGKLKLMSSEYMFSLATDPDRTAEEGASLLFTTDPDEDEDTTVVRSGEKDVFTAKIRPYLDGAYIFGVEVNEGLRSRGYGTRYMKSIAYAYRDRKLYLQVGSANVIACRLYRHAGFEVETEICYYMISGD